MCTLHLDIDQLRFLHLHLANDERLLAQQIRDQAALEIRRVDDLNAFGHGRQQHVARSWR